jgi:putative exporter of polyketide antibiotics
VLTWYVEPNAHVYAPGNYADNVWWPLIICAAHWAIILTGLAYF